MKKLRIYIDTSVIGGCFDEEYKSTSIKLFEEIKSGIKIGIISDITIGELINAPMNVKEHYEEIEHLLEKIPVTNEAGALANEYISEKILTEKSLDDCLHIALATINKVDLLVSWNFKHIVNYNKIIQFNAVNMKNGFSTLQIYSPKEVIDNE